MLYLHNVCNIDNVDFMDFEKEKEDELIKQDNGNTVASECEHYTDKTKNMYLSGMYRTWFLDYASYVILERAVPHIEDGLKPVQRRILYNMHVLDNGKLIKVQNIAGTTMKYHPHGDASINDAIVQIGQKGYLIDTQGNWGNILTGDDAAAGRYIEAKLSRFAQEAVFSDKITQWKKTYDGATVEPVCLPVKFPLLLAQGSEGIAVGLSSKILSHNFVEICRAACSYLKGEEFELYPDFPTGGYIDVSRYNDGERGSNIKSRAKIDKIDSKTLSISELPAGKTTQSLIDSILKAVEKGKIRIKRIDDMTASSADIRITLASGVSSDKAIAALYAFTDCEVSISPNCCVIENSKPLFTNVSYLLKHSVERTKERFLQELEIKLKEKQEAFLNASLERIFIEERIYKDKKFEESADETDAINHIKHRIEPFKEQFVYEVTDEHLKRLLEIKMARILRFNLFKHEKAIKEILEEMDEIKKNIENIITYTIDWFQHLEKRYGYRFERKTKITNFASIEAAKVAERDEKLYISRQDGFFGTGLKDAEFVCNVSNLDDVIIFFRSGKYMVSKVEEKKFYGNEEVIHIDRFIKNDDRTIYNLVYKDGKSGPYYIKRFNVTSITRDKVYDATSGEKGSKIIYFTANGNGEAESIKIYLKAISTRQKIFQFQKSFRDISIKGKSARGNLLTKAPISKISLLSEGSSTLGGRKVWFDEDVNRLNYNGHGRFLGTFFAEDLIFVMLNSGECYTTTFNETNYFEDDIRIIEKYDKNKIWTVIYVENENKYPYLKRFSMDGDQSRNHLLGDDKNGEVIFITDTYYPIFNISWSGDDSHRKPIDIDGETFVGVKSIKAKGKRLSTFCIGEIKELEPKKPDPVFESDHFDEDGDILDDIDNDEGIINFNQQ